MKQEPSLITPISSLNRAERSVQGRIPVLLKMLTGCLMVAAITINPAGAATLPSGFAETVVASGLSSPTTMEFAPDGRLFVSQQGGQLRVIKNGSLLATPFLTVTVDNAGERGLLGIAFDPNFAANRYVYVYYTATTPAIHNRVSRFTANGDTAVAGSEVVILDLNNLSGASNHNGGGLHFGNDGKLYISAGENANSANSQTLANLLGKILRLNSDGTIPTDNPFYTTASGINRAIWALGLRNPFTFAVQPGTGRIFINDVGETAWEEINDVAPGANYGWPNCEGDCSPASSSYRNPIFRYGHGSGTTSGNAIAGGAFYNPTVAQFPANYVGIYFFTDYTSGWIRKLDPANGNLVSGFATGISSPVDLKIGADGRLYYLARGNGAVYAISSTSSGAPQITQQPVDQTVQAGQAATFTVGSTGTLNHQWQRNGVNLSGAISPSYTLGSASAADDGAAFRCVLSNAAGPTTSNPAFLHVSNNNPPAGTIASPANGTLYTAGDTIQFAGTATDSEDGSLSASAFGWTIVFHHDTHTHPFVGPINGVVNGLFTIPTLGETAADVWYRINLTVTDSGGQTQTSFRDVSPRTATVSLTTRPPGLQVTLDGQPVTTPVSVTSVVGMYRNIGVISPQTVNGTDYTFASWSDGGAATHSINSPSTDTTYTATYSGQPAVTVIGTKVFTNPAAITIPALGAGSPYPSPINVAGLGGTISAVTVTLKGFAHTYPGDVDVLLVGPDGQKAMIVSDVGNTYDVNNVTLTLADAATASLPVNAILTAGTFKPTDAAPGEARDVFPAPAPALPYGSVLSVFNGLSANGLWSLYVQDDGAGDAGAFTVGWSLAITTTGPASANTAPTIGTIPDQTTAVNTSTVAIPFTIADADTPLANLTLSKGSSNPALVPASGIVFGGSGVSRTVTVSPAANQTGTATITVTVSDGSLTASDTFVLTVTAASPPPAVALTAPNTGATYVAPAAVNLAASVTANSHTITKVQFYNGATLVGEDATAPYGYTWNAVGVGSYSLMARIIYDAGSSVDSTAANIAVTTASGSGTVTYNNPAAITIPDIGAGSPYPSPINVAGLSGTISAVTVTLKGFAHTYPGDVDVLLVGPGGQKAMILSDVGNTYDVNNVTLTLADAATSFLPVNAILTAGTFKPTDAAPGEARDVFPAPAPAKPYGSVLSVFNGLSANGLWSLYVQDDGAGDAGAFTGGWSLAITTTGTGAPDTVAPTVSLTAPANNATVSGRSVIVSADASDNIGVVGALFALDGVAVMEDTAAPYSISWNSTTVTDGPHVLTAVARDAVGNQTTSSVVNVIVSNPSDSTPPSVPAGITAAVSPQQINLTWNDSTDDVAVVGYGVYRNGNLIATVTRTVYSDTGLLPATTNSYELVAFDAAGNNSDPSLAVIALTPEATFGAATGPLRVLASNPRYFTDGSGKAIYLTGSHTWGNNRDYGLSDPPPPFDFTAYLNFLQGHNHNFFRLWTWELTHSYQGALHEMWWRLPFPWLRPGPGVANDGKPKFDLDQFNQSYFDRLRARVIEAGNWGMYVSVMLWDGYGLQGSANSTDGFPFTTGNNVNGINSSGIESQSLVNAAVTARQEAYAQKVIDTVNDLDNVLYEIANESGYYSTAWQYHMINFIKQNEAARPKQHPVGMTFQNSNGPGGENSGLYDSPADWISPSDQYPISDGTKVIINDTDHSYYYTGLVRDGPDAQQTWVWKNFLNGNNTLFMDPYLVVWAGRNVPDGASPDPYWDVLRKSLGYTKFYADKMDLAAMTPQSSLASSGACLANPGTEYLVYSGSTSFTVTVVAGSYRYEWFNLATGQIVASGIVNISVSKQSFTAPFSGAAVLYLKVAGAP